MALGCWIHCLVSKIGMGIPAGSRLLVFGRAFFGFTSSMLCFWGVFLMPLSLAVVLYYSQPIWASILNYFFNSEPLSALQIASILSSMVGVIFLSYP